MFDAEYISLTSKDVAFAICTILNVQAVENVQYYYPSNA